MLSAVLLATWTGKFHIRGVVKPEVLGLVLRQPPVGENNIAVLLYRSYLESFRSVVVLVS
jgi:hypothetical protein